MSKRIRVVTIPDDMPENVEHAAIEMLADFGGREVVLRRMPWPYESKVTAEEIALYDSGKPLYVAVTDDED